jgi:hypothetical protein
MEIIIGIVLIVIGLLQLILFFKLWGMTNNVKEIKDALNRIQLVTVFKVDSKLGTGWANDVSEDEKITALPLITKLAQEEVIAKIISSNRMEVWTLRFWESEKDNPQYKLIYKK